MYFPNYLIQRYCWLQQAKTRKPFRKDQCPKLSIIVNELFSNDYEEPHLFMSDIGQDYDEIAEKASYEYCINPELRDVFYWITKRIMSTINIDNYLSTNVYIRIGTSMLNKLVENNKLEKELNIYYHDNLVANVASLLSVLNTEDLPF